MRRRRLLKAGLSGALLAAGSRPAAAEGVTTTGERIETWDGKELAATVYDPPGDEQVPAVLMTHGYGGTKADVSREATRYAENGYLVVGYDSRGFGDSEGVSGFNGPKEVRDVSALLDWLAAQDRVLTTGPDDPRVGMDGISYGGGIQLNGAAFDDRIDAIVPRMTWHDLVYAAAPQDVIKATWDSFILGAGAPSGYGLRTGDPTLSGPDPRLYRFVAEAVVRNRMPEEAREYFRERSAPKTRIEEIRTPTLLLQGWPDNLLSPNQAIWTFEGLRAQGVETALGLYPGGHDDSELVTGLSSTVRSKLDELSLSWLDRHVKPGGGPPSAVPDVSYHVAGADEWRTAEEFPPRPAERTALDLSASAATDRTPLVNTAAPTSLRGPTGSLLAEPSLDAPGSSVGFEFEATAPVELVGRPRLRLPVEPLGGDAHLFAKLHHVTGGTAPVIYEQVTAMAVDDPATLDEELIAVQQDFAAGDRLRLTLSTTDNGYFTSREATGIVLSHAAADDATLSVPLVSAADEPFEPVAATPGSFG
jgi:ABC-2 type transport system ATP-binding protein